MNGGPLGPPFFFGKNNNKALLDFASLITLQNPIC